MANDNDLADLEELFYVIENSRAEDSHLVDLEELFYVIENSGAEDMKIIPANGGPP
jgi:hypothetical protein